jgi:hypothetical protein
MMLTGTYSIHTGPDNDFCGFFPGFFLAAVLDSDVLGRYELLFVFMS